MKNVIFKTIDAATRSGAMDAGYHFKNGTSQKIRRSALIIIYAFISVITMNSAKAQTKVAVLDFKAGAGVGGDEVDGISAIFSTYFIDPKNFTLVERRQLDMVVVEQGFQYSTLTNQQMVRIGQILNIQKMVVGDINIVSGQYNVDVRAVNVETGAVEATEGATWAKGTSYRELMQNLAKRLMTKMNTAISTTASNIEKPTTVVTLYDHLHVFPEDLGEFPSDPTNVIATLNKNSQHGYNDWRIPTNEELALMKANSSKLGLGSGTYMTTDGTKSGNVRLVSTGKTVAEKQAQQKSKEDWLEEDYAHRDLGVVINGVTWATRNVGEPGTFVTYIADCGQYYSLIDSRNVCPSGWRLPTSSEFEKLIKEVYNKSGYNWLPYRESFLLGFFEVVSEEENHFLFLPVAGYLTDKVMDKVVKYLSSDNYSLTAFEGNVLTIMKNEGDHIRGYSIRCVK